MRLFVAAELPVETIEALSETQARLRESVRGRFVAPDSLHVTLAFLGEVSSSRVDAAARAIAEACAPHGPVRCELGAWGSFGRKAKATLWQGIDTDGALEAVAFDVRKQLRDAGFSFDDKRFVAHVTLMRNADLSSGTLPFACLAGGSIERVTLFKSDLSGERPVYEPLFTAELT